jgi:hypothetical protein
VERRRTREVEAMGELRRANILLMWAAWRKGKKDLTK